MRRVLVVLLMAFLPLAMMGQIQHFKFNQDGEFASLSGTDPNNPNSSFSLQVSRSSSTNAVATASISYQSFAFASDFNSLSFTEIVGAIPASAFTGQNTQNLVLDFDTSTLDSSTSV